jgi:hypothetical protein
VRALVSTGAIDRVRLERCLEEGHAGECLQQVPLVLGLAEALPRGLCQRLLALPIGREPQTGTVDVAVVDANDTHPADEIGYWLAAPVRMVRASFGAMDAALEQLASVLSDERNERATLSPPPPEIEPAAETSRHGSLALPSPAGPRTRCG